MRAVNRTRRLLRGAVWAVVWAVVGLVHPLQAQEPAAAILPGQQVPVHLAAGEEIAYRVEIPRAGAYLFAVDAGDPAAFQVTVVDPEGRVTLADNLAEIVARYGESGFELQAGPHRVILSAPRGGSLTFALMGRVGSLSPDTNRPGRLYPGSIVTVERLDRGYVAWLDIPPGPYPRPVVVRAVSEEAAQSLSVVVQDRRVAYADLWVTADNEADRAAPAVATFWTAGGPFRVVVFPNSLLMGQPAAAAGPARVTVSLGPSPPVRAVGDAFQASLPAEMDLWVYPLELFVKFSGVPPAAIGPLGPTNLYITELFGQFEMTTQKLTIQFGLSIQTAEQFAGVSLVKLTGSVTLQLEPSFRLTTSSEFWLIGWKLAKADVVISDRGFSVDAELDLVIVKIVGYLAFGLDKDDEFTLAAGVQASVNVKANAVIWLIPPVDITIGPVGAEAGKFCSRGSGPTSKTCPQSGWTTKTWGGQAFLNLLGFQLYAFIDLQPLRLDLATGASPYKVIRPDLRARAALQLFPGRDVAQVDVMPSRQVAIVEKVHPFNWESQLPLIAVRPDGVAITPTLAYSHTQGTELGRVFLLDNPLPGRWTFHVQTGNTIEGAVGTDPEPQLSITVEQLENQGGRMRRVQQVQGSPAHIYGDERPQALSAAGALESQSLLSLTGAGRLRVTWQAADLTDPELVLDIYAQDELGKRWPITRTTALGGSHDWSPDIPGGVYTFTVAANDGRNMPVISQVRFTYADTTPPAPVQGVGVENRADRSALVRWDVSRVDPDVAAYVVEVDAGSRITVSHPISTFIVSGMDAGSNHRVRIAAVDLSGNVGQAVEVGVRAPDLVVTARWPADGEASDLGYQVRAAFNQPVELVRFAMVDGAGQPVSGTVRGLTFGLGAMVESAEPVWGVDFTPAGGWLDNGVYTAEVTVRVDEPTARALQAVSGMRTASKIGAGENTFCWSFTITGQAGRVLLPLVTRDGFGPASLGPRIYLPVVQR